MSINLKNYSFLPNSNIELFNKIYCKKPDITNILYSRSSYGSDKKWVSKFKNDNYKYTVIHSTTKSGCKYLYSSTNNNGFYGIKKVILRDLVLGHVFLHTESISLNILFNIS